MKTICSLYNSFIHISRVFFFIESLDPRVGRGVIQLNDARARGRRFWKKTVHFSAGAHENADPPRDGRAPPSKVQFRIESVAQNKSECTPARHEALCRGAEYYSKRPKRFIIHRMLARLFVYRSARV